MQHKRFVSALAITGILGITSIVLAINWPYTLTNFEGRLVGDVDSNPNAAWQLEDATGDRAKAEQTERLVAETALVAEALNQINTNANKT